MSQRELEGLEQALTLWRDAYRKYLRVHDRFRLLHRHTKLIHLWRLGLSDPFEGELDRLAVDS